VLLPLLQWLARRVPERARPGRAVAYAPALGLAGLLLAGLAPR
jgi:hypothetical protein